MARELAIGSPTCALWLARPDLVDDPARSLSQLSSDERARHDRYYFEKDRRLFRVAHDLTRRVLGRLLDRTPESLTFTKNEHGRPAVEDADVHFNLSHTGGLVALAVTGGGYEVGVDVERREGRRVEGALARTCFEPRELQGFLDQPSRPEQIERFYRLWTLKEAYMKGRGLGFHLPLKRFAFDLEREPIGLWVDEAHDDGLPWTFWQDLPTEEHALALATQQPTLPPLQVQWLERPDQLAGK